MMFPTKQVILIFCCLLQFRNLLNAQQTPAVLPSLIAGETKDSGNDDADQNLKQRMFVKVFASKSKIFVGEPLMAIYKYYVPKSLSDHPSVTKQPEFTGCSVKELSFDEGPEEENINNELYSVFTFRKVQLTPLQQGMLSLGKASVSNIVELLNAKDPFGEQTFNI